MLPNAALPHGYREYRRPALLKMLDHKVPFGSIAGDDPLKIFIEQMLNGCGLAAANV